MNHEHPDSFCSKNIKLQEFEVIAINFFSRAQLGRSLPRPSSIQGGAGGGWNKWQGRSPNIFRSESNINYIRDRIIHQSKANENIIIDKRKILAIEVRVQIQ